MYIATRSLSSICRKFYLKNLAVKLEKFEKFDGNFAKWKKSSASISYERRSNTQFLASN